MLESLCVSSRSVSRYAWWVADAQVIQGSSDPLSVQYAAKFASQHRKCPSTQGEHCQVYFDKHANKSFQKSKLHTY
jgi:hypothetical protein